MTVISRLLIKIQNRISYELSVRSTKPRWISIADGANKGISLFIHPEKNPMWFEMSQGSFDQFIYDEIGRMKLPKEPVFWDVGAHIGYHTLGFGKIAASHGGKCIAFEPNPANRERLKMHIGKNSSFSSCITVINKAVSDASANMTFNYSDDVNGGSSSGGFLSGVVLAADASHYSEFKVCTVETTTGDDLIAAGEIPAPSIIKIDVEGAEGGVLRGLVQTLTTKKPVIFMEVHSTTAMLEVSEVLFPVGYNMRRVDEEHSTPSRCFVVAEPK